MSDLFKLVNITDSVLEDITPTLTLPVIQGSTSCNFQNFNSQSNSNTSQVNFNVQIPSLDTVVDRELQLQSTVLLKITLANPSSTPTATRWASNQVLFNYGATNSLQAFPFNALLSTIQCTINTASVTVNTRQVMSALLKCYNYEELAKYNSLCPSLVDSFYQNYSDGLGSNNNVLANYSVGSYDKTYQGRGVFPVTLYSADANGNKAGATGGLQITATNTGGNPTGGCFYLEFTTTEPLLFLSPWISGNSNNKAGMVGINNMTMICSIGDASRVMSNASVGTVQTGATPPVDVATNVQTISNVEVVSITNSKLLMKFLNIPPALASKISTRNVVNYNQYTPYQTNFTETVAPGATTIITGNNVQLNQIPAKILIYVIPSTYTTYTSNHFYTITAININFANKSGLLSSCTTSQLYDISVKNGLQETYYEWSGQGVSNTTGGLPKVVPTIGSVLVIDPAIDLSIDPQYSDGSTGQYSCQFQLTIKNQTETAITGGSVYMIAVNSGIFETQLGKSQIQTALLTQEMVLETKMKDAITDKHTYEASITGGSIENIGSIHKHMKMNYSRASEKEKEIDNDGSGMSAGGMAGGGEMHKKQTGRRIHRYTN
jgi:hypothetical protein